MLRQHIKNLPEKPERFFLLLAAIFGLICVFLNPPLLSTDEHYHLLRAYEISQGGITGGINYPDGLIEFAMNLHKRNFRLSKGDKQAAYGVSDIKELSAVTLGERKTYIEGSPRTTIYPPVPYLPAALGVALATSPLMMIYIARLLSFAAGTFLFYHAIRISPHFKWAMAFLALTPTSIHLRSSITADTITTALAFYYAALILSLLKKPATRKDIAHLALVSLLLSLCKIAYFLLPFLLLIVPADKFPSGRKLLAAAIVIIPALTASVAWSGFAQAKFLTDKSATENFIPEDLFASNKRDPSAQIRYVLYNPWQFVLTFVNSVRNKWVQYAVHGFFGGLGYMNVLIPFPFIIMQILMLLAIAGNEGAALVLPQRALCFSIFLGTAAFIAFLIYVQWNPYKHDVIAGLQGRYFLPVFPVLMLALTPGKKLFRLSERHLLLITGLSAAGGFALSVIGVLIHDYGI